ncbi:response regulator transcription factor [Sulfurospirillum sp. 1307]|jgi:CheY-like chemotaxis protein
MSDILDLKEEIGDLSILYVEDNDALRQKATKLLEKIFQTVYSASNGKEAIEIFKEHFSPIIITDINMPEMDGLELAKRVHEINPDVKIIIMSAFDSQENLLKSIKYNIFDFLKKPVEVKTLTSTLFRTIKKIKDEEEQKIFYAQLNDIFNYQSSMSILLKGRKAQVVSQKFLNFFKVESAKDFNHKFHDLGTKFLKHDGFLYNDEKRDWFDEASRNPDKLYHVKIADTKHKMHHFIFKLHYIPKRKGYSIVSLDDITELNLLGLFDKNQEQNDSYEEEQRAIFDLLRVILNNGAQVTLYNYYRGISIVNDAIISEVLDDKVVLKSTFTQQKAILREKGALIYSEALPKAVLCKNVVKNDFETQTIVFSNLRFLEHSAIERKIVRVEPDKDHTISMFFNGRKSLTPMKILDISLNGIKIEASSLPVGLEEEAKVRIDMVFTVDKKHMIINSDASVYKIVKKERSYYIICFLHPDEKGKRTLTEYISKQQIKIIKEFKGLR